MARTGLIYGDSGCYKTTAIKHFSHYIYETTGKGTLLLSMDGGGWEPLSTEINAGIVSPFRCPTSLQFPALREICANGKWPAEPEETRPSKINLISFDPAKWGGMAVEGITSIGQSLLQFTADAKIKLNEPITGSFAQRIMVDGVEKILDFTLNTRDQYMLCQRQMFSLVSGSAALPHAYVLWTALEKRVEEDDGSRTLIYGPDCPAGKKLSLHVPNWLGDCIHAQGFTSTEDVEVADPSDKSKKVMVQTFKTTVRMYYQSHPDPVTGVKFPAKPRIATEHLPGLWKEFPGGYFVPGLNDGFDKYLHTLDRLRVEKTNGFDEWRRKVDERFKGQGQGKPGGAGVVASAVPRAVPSGAASGAAAK
jgi:hypothetical protein